MGRVNFSHADNHSLASFYSTPYFYRKRSVYWPSCRKTKFLSFPTRYILNPTINMKLRRPIFSALLAIFCVSGCKDKPAPQAAVPKPEGVLIEVQIFSMSRELAAQTLLNQPIGTSGDAILKNVQALVASKQAKLVASPTVSAVSGNQAVIESIFEYRYPTEFEAPQIPQTVGSMVTKTTKTTTVTQETTSFPRTPSTPTTFEVKNTGTTLQIEPTIDTQNSLITLSIAVQNTALSGTKVFKTENNGEIEQPEFYTKKVTTNAVVKSGGVILLGTTEPDRRLSKDIDLTEVVFMRATLQKL